MSIATDEGAIDKTDEGAIDTLITVETRECRGRIYASLLFRRHNAGRIYATPTRQVGRCLHILKVGPLLRGSR